MAVLRIGGPRGTAAGGLEWKGAWTSGRTYEKNQIVRQPFSTGAGLTTGGAFVCLVTHVSSSENKPGIETGWETYWAPMAAEGDSSGTPASVSVGCNMYFTGEQSDYAGDGGDDPTGYKYLDGAMPVSNPAYSHCSLSGVPIGGTAIIDKWVTRPGEPGISEIPAGDWSFSVYAKMGGGDRGDITPRDISHTKLVISLVKVTYDKVAGAVEYTGEEEIGSYTTSTELTSSYVEYTGTISVSSPVSLGPFDRVGVILYGKAIGLTGTNVIVTYQGSQYPSQFSSPINLRSEIKHFYNKTQWMSSGDTNLNYGDLVYGVTTRSGGVYAANAGYEVSHQVVGIVTERDGILSTSSGEITLLGEVTNQNWSWTAGATLYLSDSDGGMTEDPSGLAYTVPVGFAITPIKIWFNPDIPVSSSGSGTSSIITGTAGDDLNQYDIVYSDAADSGFYKKAQIDGTDGEANAVGIVTATGGILTDESGEITLFGQVTNGSWSFTPGGTIFLDTVAGAITQVQPSAAQYFVKPLGFAIAADTIWFDPDIGIKIGASTGSSPSGGSLCVPINYLSLTDSDYTVFDSADIGLGAQWTQPTDLEISSISIYLDTVVTAGNVYVEIYDSWLYEVVSETLAISSGAAGDERWIRGVFSSPVQLRGGRIYEIHISGSAGAEYYISYNGVNTDIGSSLPDFTQGISTTDGWESISGLGLTHTAMIPLFVLNSDTDHLPQLYFARSVGNSVFVPGTGNMTIPETGVLADMSGLTGSIDYCVYAYNNSGELALSITTDLPTTVGGYKVSEANPNYLYLGRIYPITWNTSVIPVDVSDRRLVVNAYNKRDKPIGKMCPYRSATSESPTEVGGLNSWMGGTDFKIEFLVDETSMNVPTVIAQVIVKIKGSSKYVQLSIGFGGYWGFDTMVTVKNESASFMNIPVNVLSFCNYIGPGYYTLTPSRGTSGDSDTTLIYFDPTGNGSFARSNILGTYRC